MSHHVASYLIDGRLLQEESAVITWNITYQQFADEGELEIQCPDEIDSSLHGQIYRSARRTRKYHSHARKALANTEIHGHKRSHIPHVYTRRPPPRDPFFYFFFYSGKILYGYLSICAPVLTWTSAGFGIASDSVSRHAASKHHID